MTNKDGYLGPHVEHNPDTVGDLKKRVTRFVAYRAKQIHRAAVLAWAATDDGAYPTLEDAYGDARDELFLLVDALGEWAGVASGAFPRFGPSLRRGRLDNDDWEWDLYD